MLDIENNINVFELNCDYITLILIKSFMGLQKHIIGHRGNGPKKIALCTVITHASTFHF